MDVILTHPLVVFVVIALVVSGFDRASARGRGRNGSSLHAATVIAAVGILLVYVGIVFWYASVPTYFDPAEPTITAVASAFAAGHPLYPALDAPERYAHIYGPSLFIVQAALMWLLGQSIFVSKAIGVAAAITGLILGYRVFAARGGRVAALVAIAGCAAFYMDFGNASFWTRPDALLLLCAIVGLVAMRLPGRVGTALLLGAAAGLALNLKVSGPLYLLPAFALVMSEKGWPTTISAAAIALVAGLWPFLLPSISLAHYVQYIELSARNGLVLAKLRQNLEWALLLAAPLAVIAWSDLKARSGERLSRLFVLSLGIALVVVTVIAAKPGAGPYHLLPFVPVLAYALVAAPRELWNRVWPRSILVAAIFTAVIIAVPRQSTFVQTVSRRDLTLPIEDLRRFADAHPARRIAVGYAGTSRVSDARPEIVFRTGEYLLDAPAIQEHRLSGLDVPASTLDVIRSCQIEYWLVPQDAEPFAVPSAYFPNGPRDVFSETFRQVFASSYQRTGSTRFFDVWECRNPSQRSAGAP